MIETVDPLGQGIILSGEILEGEASDIDMKAVLLAQRPSVDTDQGGGDADTILLVGVDDGQVIQMLNMSVTQLSNTLAKALGPRE